MHIVKVGNDRVSVCLAVFNALRCRYQYNLGVVVEHGFRDTLTVPHRSGEYSIDIEGKTASDIAGLVTVTLGGIS